MSHYQTPADLRFSADMVRLAPAEAKGFLAFDHAAKRADGRVPPAVREMISLAVALTTQCAYCIDVHVQAAKRLGVTAEEVAEVAAIAAAVKAGGGMAHGLLALRLYGAAAAPEDAGGGAG